MSESRVDAGDWHVWEYYHELAVLHAGLRVVFEDEGEVPEALRA